MQYAKQISPYLEVAVWSVGLVCLAMMDPSGAAHFSLCFFKWVGFSFCPGCGIGHSISWLFHGDLMQSLQAHPLGIFALIILISRITTLIKSQILNSGYLKQQHGNNR